MHFLDACEEDGFEASIDDLFFFIGFERGGGDALAVEERLDAAYSEPPESDRESERDIG